MNMELIQSLKQSIEQKQEIKLEMKLQLRQPEDKFIELYGGCDKVQLDIDGTKLTDQDSGKVLSFNPRARTDENGKVSFEYALINSRRLDPKVIAQCGPAFTYAKVTDGWVSLFFGTNYALRESGEFYQFVIEDMVDAGSHTSQIKNILGVHELGEEIFIDHNKASALELEYAKLIGLEHVHDYWFKNRRKNIYEVISELALKNPPLNDLEVWDVLVGMKYDISQSSVRKYRREDLAIPNISERRKVFKKNGLTSAERLEKVIEKVLKKDEKK